MFDWFKKRPATPATAPQTDLPAAAHLHREFAGHPSRGLTPARLAYILQQAEQGDLTAQAELFQDMEEKDGHLAAELAKRKRAVTQLDWALTPPRDASAREKKAAQRLEDGIRDRVDLGRLRHDLLDGIGHGYSCVELGWQRGADGLWWPETLIHRSPSWFTCPPADRNTLHLRDGSAHGAPLIPFGWIPHVHPARSGYLPRVGLHRVLSWAYLFKNYAVRDLAEFLDVYGLPIRLGKYPTGADAVAKSTLLDAVLAIGHHAAGIIPDSMAVEIVNAMAQGNAAVFQVMIELCEATQSKAILGGTLTSQTGANGNRSLGDVHNEVRLDIRNDDAIKIDRSLSDYLVYPIAVLNGLASPDRCPRFTSDIQEPDDLALYADALPKLVAIGLPIPARYAHEKLKIPEPDGDEPVLTPGRSGLQAATEPGTGSGQGSVVSGQQALSSLATDHYSLTTDIDPTPVSAHTEQLAQDAAPHLRALIDHVRALVDRAESLDALRDDLLNAYGDLDTAELTNVMALAFAAADLSGRYDARHE